ncbi:TonB-dependent receptor domain-containing protein [Calditrichota bacterium]
MRLLPALLTIISLSSSAFTQTVEITGRAQDAQTGEPLAAVNIVLESLPDSGFANGGATDLDGNFRLIGVMPGKYFLVFSYVGYEPALIEDIVVYGSEVVYEVGSVDLTGAAIGLAEVEVSVHRPKVEFKIDRKVVDAGKYFANSTGSAVEVLQSVPSVDVDLEGNVTLRGSSNFTVMIDGQPTILDASDALQQIPAGMVANIEIITNPSAKYESRGSTGIINVNMKKNQVKGINGMVTANGGMNDQYGGEALVSHKEDKYSVTLSVNSNSGDRPGKSIERTTTVQETDTHHLEADGTSNRIRGRQGARADLELRPSQKDQVKLGLSYGGYFYERSANLNYQEWTDPGGVISEYRSDAKWRREGDHYSGNLNYKHEYDREKHVLSAMLDFRTSDGDEFAENMRLDVAGDVVDGRRTTETGPGQKVTFQMDYIKPLLENSRLEAGVQSSIANHEDATTLALYDDAVSSFVVDPIFNNKTENSETIHSAYAIGTTEQGKMGMQLGLRTEYTYRNITTERDNQEYNTDRWDIFPSLHTSYHLDDQNQLLLSYSRRMRQPRGWQLEPFETWSDAYNVRRGNPSMKPEFINSYETGYQKDFGDNSFSAELYYRNTINKIESLRSPYSEGVTLRTFDNVGEDHALGSELSLDNRLTPWWGLRSTYDFYRYQVIGESDGYSFDKRSFSWSLRLDNDFRLSPRFRVQLDAEYESPTVSSHEDEVAQFEANMALRYEIIPKTLTTTLQVRDLFGTDNHEETEYGNGVTNYSYHERDAPIISLEIAYNFNNYQSRRQRDGYNGNGGGEDEF